jgi:hypothetical protein
MTQAIRYVTKDSIIRSPNLGSGKDPHNTAGSIGGVEDRTLIQFDTAPSPVTSLNWVKLWMKRSTGSPPTGHDTPDNGASLIPARITEAWSEGSKGADHFYHTDNAVEWPGPAVTGALSSRGSQPGSGWWFIYVTEIAQAWLDGSPDYGIRLDGDGADDIVFDSLQGSAANKPYLEWDYSNNTAPNAPTDLTPAPDTLVASAAGTTATVGGRHTDTEGDSSSKYQAQAYTASATDDEDGNILTGSLLSGQDDTVTATTAHNAIRSHTFTGMPTRTEFMWRLRFYDGQWGAWSRLQAASTAYLPSAVNPATEPGTLTPTFADSISSSDPSDFITATQDVVYQDTPSGTITKWDSGKDTIGGSPTRAERDYAGTALVYGTTYRRRRRIWNRDDVPSIPDSAWPASATDVPFTQYEPTGAAISPGDVSTKIDDLTQTFTLTDPASGNIDQARLWIRNEAGTTILYDSGVVSEAAGADIQITVPADILDWGMNVLVSGAVRVSGNANMGPEGTASLVHINARPGAPTGIVVSGGQTVLRSDGVWVTTDSTPALLIPFRDTDIDLGYTETPERQEVEIRDDAEAPFGASPYIDATDPSETFTSPALTVEETYDFRARYDDTAAARSDWSERVYVKHSAAPTLSDVTPEDEDVVTDPTPTFEGTYAHTGSVAEESRRLVLTDGDTVVYDSGYVEAGDIAVPANTLPNDTELDYELTSVNEDGLVATVTGTITTDFTQPDPVTGLTVTSDPDALALSVSWDESGLPVGEFEAYFVYAKSEGGQFVLVTTLTDPTSRAILYRAADHNRETVIRVTQSNGFMESEPAEAEATLLGEDDEVLVGYWLKRPGTNTLLEYLFDHADESPTDLEIIRPLERTDKVILDWGTTLPEGSFRISTDDRDLIRLLRSYKAGAVVAILAPPYGDSRYVRLTSCPATDQPAAWIGATVTYVSVTPEGQGF